jgi:uncharacterized protein YrrD
MEFKIGTSVHTMDGKLAGSLERVVIHPDAKAITHVVVQKGILSNQDRVVPVEKILSASHERIALACTSGEFEGMPSLDVKQYEPRDTGENLHRMSSAMYTSPALDLNAAKKIIRTIPDELVVLKEGARVMSEDDQHVGNIDRVRAESGKVTHFIASQGSILKTRKAIPVEWVRVMNDDEIRLTISAQQFDDLPKEYD